MPTKAVALPPVERLRERLKYDPDTGSLTWKPKDVTYGYRWRNWNSRYAGKEAGMINTLKSGYQNVFVRLDGRIMLAHRIAWKMMTGEEPPEQIDHEDGDGTNNRWRNLRDGTDGVNAKNRAMYSRNTSGVTGVVWSKQKRKWRAELRVDGKTKRLGYFDEIDDAAKAVAEERSKAGYDPRHGLDLAPYHKAAGL